MLKTPKQNSKFGLSKFLFEATHLISVICFGQRKGVWSSFSIICDMGKYFFCLVKCQVFFFILSL